MKTVKMSTSMIHNEIQKYITSVITFSFCSKTCSVSSKGTYIIWSSFSTSLLLHPVPTDFNLVPKTTV